MNTINNFLLHLIILAALALAGCSAAGKAATDSSSAAAVSTSTTQRAPIAVQVFEVQPQTEDEPIIPAVLSTEATAAVLAQRDGVIIDLRVQQGAHVTKGQELARINDEELRAQFAQAELDVARLAVEERQFEVTVKVNQSELDQEAALLKDGLASRRQFDRAQYKLEGSIQDLEKARLATQTARSRVESVKVEFEKCIIRAPLTGIVTQSHAKLGTSIVRNDKLFEVARLSPLEVKFQAPLEDLAKFAPGRILNLSIPGSDRIVAQARIRRFDPVVEAMSNTRGCLADVSGGTGLIPGLAVNVRLPREAGSNSFTIPRVSFPATADLRPGSPNSVFVLEGDRAKNRVVWVNATEGDQVEINSGLTPGDRVILAPPADLKAGDLIHAR